MKLNVNDVMHEEQTGGMKGKKEKETKTEKTVSKASFGIGTKIMVGGLIVIGLGLFTVSTKCIIDNMRLEQHATFTSEAVTVSDGLTAEAEGTEAPTEEEVSISESGSIGEPAYDEDDNAATQDDVMRLQQELIDTQNKLALKEQELNNANAMLDAGATREDQLRSELEGTPASEAE